MIEPIGLGHARADAGIDEIEQEQSGQALRRGSRQGLYHGAADVVADDAGLCDAERIHQRQHVGGMLVGAERTVGLVAVAEPAQVGRKQREAIGEPRHHRFPGQPEFGPAVQQHQRLAGSCAGDMECRAVGANAQMLHDCLLFCPRFSLGRDFTFPPIMTFRNYWFRGLSGPPSSPRTRPQPGG